MAAIGRAEDFDQEIGHAFDTSTGANGRRFREQHDDIWLHGIGAFEEDVERGGDDPPPSDWITGINSASKFTIATAWSQLGAGIS
jgi:hypothetical protein